jgi:hypothetical protein
MRKQRTLENLLEITQDLYFHMVARLKSLQNLTPLSVASPTVLSLVMEEDTVIAP